MVTLVPILMARANQFSNCTVDTCPVEDSVYGYYPSKPANLIFAGLSAIAFIGHLILGIKWKTWTFLIGLGIGSLAEAIGYVGRIRLRSDPFSRANIGTQLVALTVAPAFIAGGIYLTLKHLILIYGPQYSRLPPKWYTWIFICCDILSILLQGAGASLESAGSNVNSGNTIIMVGVVFQTVTLAIFGIMAVDVYLRIVRSPGAVHAAGPYARASKSSRYYRGLIIAIAIAYTTITIRCIYRIAEMAGGWRNSIMQNQTAFILLDSVMVVLAIWALLIYHPGAMFKASYTNQLQNSPRVGVGQSNGHELARSG